MVELDISIPAGSFPDMCCEMYHWRLVIVFGAVNLVEVRASLRKLWQL